MATRGIQLGARGCVVCAVTSFLVASVGCGSAAATIGGNLRAATPPHITTALHELVAANLAERQGALALRHGATPSALTKLSAASANLSNAVQQVAVSGQTGSSVRMATYSISLALADAIRAETEIRVGQTSTAAAEVMHSQTEIATSERTLGSSSRHG